MAATRPRMWPILVTLLGFTSCSLAFNVDTNIPIVKVGRRGSYFGFSVAQHQKDDINGGSNPSFTILVGAPKDNVTYTDVSDSIRRIVRPGQVYSCPISSLDDDCEPIKLVTEERPNENLTDQWLGVSVASQATTGGMAVACAHRFKYVDPGIAVLGLGLCYTMTNSLDFNEFSEPCFGQVDDGEQQFGHCLAGTSVSVSKAGDILVGTPRAWAGRGGVFMDKLQRDLGDEGTWKMNHIKAKKRDDDPEPTCSLDSYLGLSTKVGKILPGSRPTYVGGAPRSRENGEVILFQDLSSDAFLRTEEKYRLRGDLFGSGYGYSVEVVDLNGDGEDDLVVGAPYYHGAQVGGAIYVYMNPGGRDAITRDTKPMIVTSREMLRSECTALNCENAQFGIAIANLGDIDRDGFNDIAVGAPYEGSGCVYIFRGHQSGMLTDYSQRICGEDLPSARPLQTFGYSLVGGSDVDKNGLPDIAVGAYESNKMLILRARPVITIQALMQPVPDKIDPLITQCPINGEPLICFKIRACFRYSIEPKDKSTRRQAIDIDYRLEAETFTGKAISRAYFKRRSSSSDKNVVEGRKRLTKADSDHECQDEVVYLQKLNTDFLNPIQFQLTFTLGSQTAPTMIPGQPLPSINNFPVINEEDAKEILNVDFVKNCGDDEKCHSNLQLTAFFEALERDSDGSTILKSGQVNELKLHIAVNNLGEDAHETTVTVLLPEDKSIQFIQASPRTIGCVPMDTRVECSKVGNPLQKGKSSNFVMRLKPANISPSQRFIDLKLRVNTTSEETDISNDFITVRIKVVIETDMVVVGSSSPAEMFYGGEIRGESAIHYEDEIGGLVVHNYQVVNEGKSRVPNATLLIYWPYEVENGYPQGKHLLYLMEEPKAQAPAICYTPPDRVNPLGIKNRKKAKSSPSSYAYDERKPQNDTEMKTEALRKRVKREKVIQSELIDYQGRNVRAVRLDCDERTAKCFVIRCELGEMSSGQSIAIKLRARLWNSTFLEDYRNVDHVQIYSKAQLQIDPQVNVLQPTTDNDVARAMLRAFPDISSVEQPGVPIWVYILAGCAGLIVLIVIILLLWKCGFFKRRTPTDMRKTRQYKKMKYKSPGNDEDYYS